MELKLEQQIKNGCVFTFEYQIYEYFQIFSE